MKIIAHRGNDGIHKENSIESILNSLDKNYIDGVEFDIRLTKDNKFILNHDPFYKEYFIKKTKSYKLIKKGLSLLENVLDNVKGNKILLIEVKEEGNIKKTCKYLNKIICNYNLNIYICSFNYDFIKFFHDNYNIRCGLIIGSKINTKYINNNFDFNSISYKYKGKIPNKETFTWTINDINNIKNHKNIITDKPLEIYNYISDKF